MPERGRDPYQTLGVASTASDAELRAAYRGLVQRHHPDHNGGSAESARRFEAVQNAYAQIRQRRQTAGTSPRMEPSPAATAAGSGPYSSAGADPEVESRLAALERELHAAREARDRARQAAREAAAAPEPSPADGGPSSRPSRPSRPSRASREELGYIDTDDSFAKILADAAAEIAGAASDLAERLSGSHGHDEGKRSRG